MRKQQLLGTALALSIPFAPLGCATQSAPTPAFGSANKSWTSKFSSAMKDGAGKANAALTPKPEPPADPISLSNKTKKKGPDLYVALGLAQEKAGQSAEAEKLYKKALDVAPNDAAALLAYGHLLDRRGDMAEAKKVYRKACAKNPKNATAQNDLGLCLHRQGELEDSAKALQEAVRLQPDRKLYRNNLATVLVELNRRDEAFAELAAAHGAAAAHYNLGYLLEQKGDSQAALAQFQMALSTDSTLVNAQAWIDKLSPPGAAGALLAGPVATDQPSPQASSTESPSIQMPAEPTPQRYTGTASAEMGSYYAESPASNLGRAELAQQPSRRDSLRHPQQGPYDRGEIGEMPPTPDEAGIELLPPVPAEGQKTSERARAPSTHRLLGAN